MCPVDSNIFADRIFAAAGFTNDDNQDSIDQGSTHGPSICQRRALLPFTSAATTSESSTRPAATNDSLTGLPATTTQSLTSMAAIRLPSTNPEATS